MSNNKREVQKVAEIVKVLNGGIEFYHDAIDKVDSQSLRNMFARMADEKRKAVTLLQPFVIIEQGETETGSSFAVSLREIYTNMLATLSSDSDHTYISELEEVEDKVLAVIDSALEEDQPYTFAAELQTIRVSMQKCHDEMKALQLATA